MIKIGDIVARREHLDNCRVLCGSVNFFHAGYFMVLEVRNSLIQNSDGGFHTVCLIMDSSGMTSWIDKQSIKVVVKSSYEIK
tara:strand:- start:1672 stop:1917 length:246 start_codon:yes stop_codon:yes gene_type:complete